MRGSFSNVLGTGRLYDYATLAYSASSGDQFWAARYDGPGNSSDGASSLAVSPDGSTLFVTGSSTGSSSYSVYATVAYSASEGAKLWAARYEGPGNYGDFASSVAVSPDGSRVFVTGGSHGSGSSYDYATVPIDRPAALRAGTRMAPSRTRCTKSWNCCPDRPIPTCTESTATSSQATVCRGIAWQRLTVARIVQIVY